MRKLYVLIVALFMYSLSYAQYDRSAGLRFGSSWGVTFKKFVHEEEAFELLLSGRHDGLQLTGLYEFHSPLKWGLSDRLYLNYGMGGHFGFERNDYSRVFFLPGNQAEFIGRGRHLFAMGIDALVGIEYRWLAFPLTVGIDMKPYFDFIGMRSTRLRFWDTALTVKYIF